MPSTRNSYPKRAYRRKQRARVRYNRLVFAGVRYDSAYWPVTAPDGTRYVTPARGEGIKKTHKTVARRRARRAKWNEYGNGGSYRKVYDMWWLMY